MILRSWSARTSSPHRNPWTGSSRSFAAAPLELISSETQVDVVSSSPSMRNAFEGAKVLITGGLGFIGSNLARRLAGLGADLTLVDSLIPEYGGNPFNIEGFRDQMRVNISDVRDTYSLEPLVRGKDFLFNLAGQTSHLDSMLNPVPDLEINCRAQLSI